MQSKPPRSSSPDREGAADAILWSEQRPAGPVRLPARDPAGFIAEFNKTYGTLGWKMDPAKPET